MGSTPICRIGYGDDGSLNGGVFADLDVWLEKELFPIMRQCFEVGGRNNHNMMAHAINVESANIGSSYEVVQRPINGSDQG